MEVWRFIDDNLYSAEFNMALDDAISTLVKAGKSKPTLRLYGWNKPSITIGVFQKAEGIDLDYCRYNDLPVVRRPTGGRGILHYDELTYSFSSKNSEIFTNSLFQTYYSLSTAFQKAFILTGIRPEIKSIKRPEVLHKSPLCFKYSSYGELSFNGVKIAGSAQKRWKGGFLQQGSIPYSIDNDTLKEVFMINEEDHQPNILGIKHLIQEFDPSFFKKNIRKSFEETFKIVFVDSHPSSEEIEIADRLAFEKYPSLY